MNNLGSEPAERGNSVSEEALQLALNKIVLNSFRPILSALVGLYLLFTVSHLLVLPEAVSRPMALLALLSSCSCLALRLLLNRQTIPARYAHHFGICVIGILLLNITAHLYLTADPLQTTNFLLVIVGIASVVLSRFWFVVTEGLIVATWSLTVWLLPPALEWSHFIFAFVSTLFLATAVFFVRLRNLRRLEEFHLLDEAQKQKLAAALHTAEESNKALERSNTELAVARDAADAASRAKSDFVANMSHEIRTPLNAVIGMANIVLEDELTPTQRDNVQMIQTSGVHLLDVLQDILDFAKIEADKLVLEKAAFNVRESVALVQQMFQLTAQEKGFTLNSKIADAVPENVFGDVVRVRQILLNLVGNAIKFTQEGEVTMEVSCTERSAETALLNFMVRDTGIGLSEDQCENIFEAFTQADTSTTRKYGGTGLGLTISARLVDAMGGRIWVDSVENVGSRFQFEVEFETAPDSVVEAKAVSEQANTPLHILLAEDNTFNQKVAVHVLETMGHTVTVADDGIQALAALSHEKFDVLLVDIQMPGLDGFEVIQQIRSDEQSSNSNHHQPAIALTAHVGAEDRRRCLAAGMDDYLTKPLRKEELHAALNRVASLKKAGEASL